ncbi:MAG: formate dehydrogenase accessory sulfurtransferase FdhD [Phycisphaerae bacterium]
MSDFEDSLGRTRTARVWRVGADGEFDTVIVERAVELVLNGRVLVRTSCLPDRLEDLALGFLCTEGLIAGPAAITECNVAPDGGRVEIRADVDPDRLVLFRERVAISSGCGSGASAAAEALTPVASDARFSPEDLLAQMKDLLQASVLFRETGGVHAASLTDSQTLLVFAEDIGRHNAVDKAIGGALRQGVDLGSAALLTTGRASSDIVAKAVRAGLPAVVSRGAVTSRAIELARSADAAVVGFARGRRLNVYTAAWRFGLMNPARGTTRNERRTRQ